MSTGRFQFSAAALLYAQSLDVIHEIQRFKTEEAMQLCKKHADVIAEMRLEAYRSIADFRDALLEQLQEEDWKGERLRQKVTATGGSYGGGRIHYLWIEPSEGNQQQRKVREVSMISLIFPIPKDVPVDNDLAWRDYWGVFDTILPGRLKVWLNPRDSDQKEQRRLGKMAKGGNFGKADPEPYCVWIPLDVSDPAGSAVAKLTKLIRAVCSQA